MENQPQQPQQPQQPLYNQQFTNGNQQFSQQFPGQPFNQQFTNGNQQFNQQFPGQQPQQPQQPPKKTSPGIIVLIVIIVFVSVLIIGGIAAALLLPALSSAREKARQASCVNNLKQIGCEMMMYAYANDDNLPNSGDVMEQLSSTGYLYDNMINICPSDKSNYSYYCQGLNGGYHNWSLPVAICNGHDGKAMIVLYLDGHVETLHPTYPLTTHEERVTFALKGASPDDKGVKIVLENARKLDRGW